MTTDKTKRFFRVSAEDFKKIPGSPIAYWCSPQTFKIFSNLKRNIGDFAQSEGKNVTTNNALFIHYFWEVSATQIGAFDYKWLLCALGGEFRKWGGNIINVIDWSPEARRFYKENIAGRIIRKEFWNMPGVTWSKISSSSPSFRFLNKNEMYQETALLQRDERESLFLLGILNSSIALHFLHILSPTINYQHEDICAIPYAEISLSLKTRCLSVIERLLALATQDWDSYETSWDFQENPLWKERKKGHWVSIVPICQYYQDLRRHWAEQTEEMQTLENRNNNMFIQAYGLQDELSAEVPWDEITLTCNPWYRYGKAVGSGQWAVDSGEMPKDPALEARLLEDTIKEFISYAVGCMMGRYSLEKPGLILANQGESFDDFIVKTVDSEQWAVNRKNGGAPESTTDHSSLTTDHYLPDQDGVIPILDEEWFVDDIVAQFKQFLRFTFGAEHFADNLDFIEKALGKDLRKYFIKDFYKDHVQRYKKRPIYWMFSSPKGSFNALIYMHRYRPDTVSIVLNEYLREFISKIRSHREHLITENNRATLAPAEKTRNLKLIDKYAAMLTELDAYERDILYPLAQQKIAIDLDDGVKVNYCKFGAALKKIPGLEAKEE